MRRYCGCNIHQDIVAVQNVNETNKFIKCLPGSIIDLLRWTIDSIVQANRIIY